MDGAHRLSLMDQQLEPLGEASQAASSWHDPYMSSKGPKVDQRGSFDLEFGSTTKFEEQDLKLDEFTRADGFHDAGSWSQFSPAVAALPALGAQFDSKHLSVSPDTSETTTPPSVQGVFDHQLRGPGINEELMLPPGEGFGSGTDEFWHRKMDEIDRKQPQNSTFPHLPYPSLDAGLGPQGALPRLPALGQGFPFSASGLPYGGQLPSYIHRNMHQLPTSKDRPSPPPTANSASSSGSSTPFVKGNMFDHSAAAWRGFTNGAPEHSYFEWNMGTCDPRGITGQKYDTSAMHNADPPHHSMMLSSQSAFGPSALSDESPASESADNKRGRGRPRRPDSATEAQFPAGEEGTPFRAKKRPIEESGGMGLEDIDERTLQFTSRQDAKPTRTLRRQCFNCRTWRDVSAWRRSVMQVGHIVCNKCGLYEKAHKKARPLNERGEFVRPGKHVPKVPPPKGVVGRPRPKPRGTVETVVGAGVMKFESDADAEADVNDAAATAATK